MRLMPPTARKGLAAGIGKSVSECASAGVAPWGEFGDGLGPIDTGGPAASPGRSGTLTRQVHELRREAGSRRSWTSSPFLCGPEIDVRHLS